MRKSLARPLWASLILLSGLFIACKDRSQFAEIENAVKAVADVLPAAMYDGLEMTDVSFDWKDTCVVMEISRSSAIPYPYGVSRDEDIMLGRDFVENMMKGYRYTAAGKSGEGEPELWEALGPLVKLLARRQANIQFRLAYTEEQPYSFSIPSSVISEAIRTIESIPISKKEYDVEPIIIEDDETAAESIPIAMNPVTTTENVSWNGDDYSITIVRTPDVNLKRVNGHEGRTYIDNTVELTIRRSNQSMFLHRKLTKESFGSYLGADYREKGILEYFEYLHVEEGELAFIAGVNYPEAADDECFSILVNIDSAGEMSFKSFIYNERDDLLEEP